MSGRSIRHMGVVGDISLVVTLVTWSWLGERHLFDNGFNPVASRHLSVGLWAAIAALAVAGFVAGRRWAPELAVVLAAGAAVLHTQSGWPLLPVDLLAVAAVYVVATRRNPLVAVASLIFATWAAYVATGQTVAGYRSRLPDPVSGHGGFLAVAGLIAIAWFLGAARRHFTLRIAHAQRERDLQTERATQHERARLRREIHDVVAHGLSVMVVQAQGAASALERRPERAAQALDAIIVTGRSALTDMRRLLDDDSVGNSPSSPLAGLEQLDQLIAGTTAAGLPTSLTIDGHQHPLPTDVDTAAYRIIQEALTNALRHAGADARASVRLAFATDAIDVRISDTGTGTTSTTDGGHGLDGIRQRAALLGGSVRTVNACGGGFEVLASLPLRKP